MSPTAAFLILGYLATISIGESNYIIAAKNSDFLQFIKINK